MQDFHLLRDEGQPWQTTEEFRFYALFKGLSRRETDWAVEQYEEACTDSRARNEYTITSPVADSNGDLDTSIDNSIQPPSSTHAMAPTLPTGKSCDGMDLDQPPRGTATGTPKTTEGDEPHSDNDSLRALQGIIYSISLPQSSTALNCTVPRGRIAEANGSSTTSPLNGVGQPTSRVHKGRYRRMSHKLSRNLQRCYIYCGGS